MDTQDVTALLTPRYKAATAQMPGNSKLWAALLDQSDNFAFQTARDGKGGPFGAQLWLYNPKTEEYLLVGTPDRPEDSNAVVSKGLASAHAEAENLSPVNRLKVVEFLAANKGKGWQVVQVSSAESCQSCRSKQVAFAEELKQRRLIKPDGFHVIFKATYEQTKRDANFNDAPYDMSFRAIDTLGVLDQAEGLYTLDDIVKANPLTAQMLMTGDLIYNPVREVSAAEIVNASRYFKAAGDTPLALVINDSGDIVSYGLDTRDAGKDPINLPEKTAIVSALHRAAQDKRRSGVFESWNLEGARVVTNISEIGPQAYAETLWYNLSGIDVVKDFTNVTINARAQEVPGIPNRALFGYAADDYDASRSLQVAYGGDVKDASIAHQMWAAQMQREALLSRQAKRIEGLSDIKIGVLAGTVLPMQVSDIVETSRRNSNYDGKQADAPAAHGP